MISKKQVRFFSFLYNPLKTFFVFPFVYFTKSARKKRRLQCSRELIAAETKALCVPMSQPFMNSVKAISIQSELKQKTLLFALLFILLMGHRNGSLK